MTDITILGFPASSFVHIVRLVLTHKGFCLYAALLVRAVTRVKAPDAALATTS
jgi:hypothetical protein